MKDANDRNVFRSASKEDIHWQTNETKIEIKRGRLTDIKEDNKNGLLVCARAKPEGEERLL